MQKAEPPGAFGNEVPAGAVNRQDTHQCYASTLASLLLEEPLLPIHVNLNCYLSSFHMWAGNNFS